jgi:hypothetical protein
LTDEEKRFRREHLQRCAACSAETRFWSMLDGILVNPDFLESPLSTRPSKPKRRLYPWAFMLAATVGVVFGVLTLDRLRRSHPPTPPRKASLPTLHATVLRTRGEVQVDSRNVLAHHSVNVGERLSTENGRACVALESGVTSCLADQSEAHFAQPRPEVVHVHLHRGRLLSRLEPRAVPYVVVTQAGSVEAKGTVFSVRVLSPDETEIVLHEGRVWLKSATASTLMLTAPARAVMRGHIRVDPSKDVGSLDGELLEFSNIDGVASSIHQTAVTSAILATSEAAPPSSSGAHRSVPPSAAELLRQAQRARAAGQSVLAERLYEHLITSHPQSKEAQVSLVSLGESELSESKRPQAALKYFDRYIAQGGPLTREARYGKIRALEALHRVDAAKRAAMSFVSDYPQSVQADALRRSLSLP